MKLDSKVRKIFYRPSATPAQVSSKVLAANYTGQVYMWADYSFTTMCDFDYTRYPFDTQSCCFKLDDRRYYVVRYSSSDAAQAEATVSAKKTHPAGWNLDSIDLIQNKYTVNVLSDWSQDPFNIETTNMDICVKIKRDSSFINAEVIGPLVAPAIVTLVSFLTGSFWNQIALVLISLLLQVLANYPLISALPPASGEIPAICN